MKNNMMSVSVVTVVPCAVAVQAFVEEDVIKTAPTAGARKGTPPTLPCFSNSREFFRVEPLNTSLSHVGPDCEGCECECGEWCE